VATVDSCHSLHIAQSANHSAANSWYLVSVFPCDHAAPTVDRLLTVPVDQTQYGPDDSGLNQLGQTCVAPIVQDIQAVAADGVTTNTRRMVKMATGSTRVASAEQKAASKAATPLDEPTVDTSAWDVSENLDGDAEMIATFKDVVFAASAHAPRFKVLAVRRFSRVGDATRLRLLQLCSCGDEFDFVPRTNVGDGRRERH
jgi:hypothetical protein